MLESNKGHVVNIASMAGWVGCNGLVDYCSSKFAAVGFDEALRLELKVKKARQGREGTLTGWGVESRGSTAIHEWRRADTGKGDECYEAVQRLLLV